MEKATAARAEARQQFKKVLRDEVKKMVSKVLDTAKEEGTGEWSKQAQALVNRLTCNGKGEKDVADYGTMNYPPGNKEVASGPKARWGSCRGAGEEVLPQGECARHRLHGV